MARIEQVVCDKCGGMMDGPIPLSNIGHKTEFAACNFTVGEGKDLCPNCRRQEAVVAFQKAAREMGLRMVVPGAPRGWLMGFLGGSARAVLVLFALSGLIAFVG